MKDDKKGNVYRHFKGNLYEIVGEAFNVHTNKYMILYKPLYDSEFEMFARDKDEFFGTVVTLTEKGAIARFTRVTDVECCS